MAAIIDRTDIKILTSPGYNYFFDKTNGLFLRWGWTQDDNPQWSPLGPEIADIEISTGDCSSGCPWCYKSNAEREGQHMNLDTLVKILDTLPDTLTQVALGITDADANPDFVTMLQACRLRGVIPNYTTSGHGMTQDIAKATADLCGAVAVSVYPHNLTLAFQTIQGFIDLGMKQVNIHLLYHARNKNFVKAVLEEAELIDGLNAVVLLGLKPTGGAAGWEPMGQADFTDILDNANVSLGFDSCSAHKFLAWAADKDMPEAEIFAEPCESSLFSIYINVEGKAYPCSFVEDKVEPVDLLVAEDFRRDVWESAPFWEFRNRHCPVYRLE